MQHLQRRKPGAFGGGLPEADHNTTSVRKRRGHSQVKGHSGNPQVNFNNSFVI